jgi:double-stranded uracil-DNA glycosylase
VSRVQSFAPLEDQWASVLILGSMPGVASLRAGEYYAHPRNAFWAIMGQLLGFDSGLSYAERVRCLTSAGIAVWDVLASCQRTGSGDAEIDDSTITVNDFAAFFREHPQVRSVFFNGVKAQACFRREALPQLQIPDVAFQRLPSTSPANASYSFEKKLAAWSVILREGTDSSSEGIR